MQVREVGENVVFSSGWLSKIHWSWIKWSRFFAISGSPATKLTVLIPLIGYMIIFNEKLSEYLHIVKEVGGAPEAVAISPRLLLIYFGLCAIALAVSIYSWLCPNQVKYYGSANVYVTNVKDVSNDYTMREIERIFTSREKFAEEYFEIRNWPGKVGMALDPASLQKQHIAYLHLYFKYLDETYPLARLMVALLYGIGVVALLIPSLGVFRRVVGILIVTAKQSFASFF